MITKIAYTILFITGFFVLGSCVRDEIPSCPPLTVDIIVKDKNYFNVDKVPQEEKKSEDLAFRAYIPTLYYQLRDAVTGEVVEEMGVFKVTGDENSFPVTFCDCIPHGKYVLSVWGGMKDDALLEDDPLTALLHADEMEGDDFYLTNDTLMYNAWNYDYTVEMERTKGKLIIQVENLPEDVNYSDKTVTGLFRSLDCEFNYTGHINVNTESEWEAEPIILTQTVLAPSSQYKGSKVSVNFYDNPERIIPTLTPKAVNVKLKRNELTVLKYVYDDGNDDFSIYILLDDSWDEIFDMDID